MRFHEFLSRGEHPCAVCLEDMRWQRDDWGLWKEPMVYCISCYIQMVTLKYLDLKWPAR